MIGGQVDLAPHDPTRGHGPDVIIRVAHVEEHQRFAFQLVRHTDRGRFDDAGVRDDGRLDLGGAEPLARQLDRVI